MIIPSRKKMIVSVTESMIENILPIAGHPFHQSILRLRFDCARLRSTFVDVTPPTDPEEKKKDIHGRREISLLGTAENLQCRPCLQLRRIIIERNFHVAITV